MSTPIYKDPRELAQNLNNIPPYNKEATVKYWTQFGDGFTDDAYESWAKEKGKQLKPRTPLNPEFAKTQLARQTWQNPEKDGTYKDQYLADDEWLQESWNELFDEILEYSGLIDEDYTRSYGPIDSADKYNHYLQWKKEGN